MIERSVASTGSLITSTAVMLGITTFALIGPKVSFIQLIGVGIAIPVASSRCDEYSHVSGRILSSTVIRLELVLF